MPRLLMLSCLFTFIAQSAMAQVAAPTPPTAPTQPVAAMPAMTTTQTAAPSAQPDLTQQLQNLMGNKHAQQSLGQVMVVGTLMGCTQKSAGKQATDAFYQQMQQVGKTVESDCRQGNDVQARALLLSTIHQKHDDPVVKAVLTCYDQQKQSIAGMGGPKTAEDMEKYARWVRDPSLADREVTTADVCKHKAAAQTVQ